MTSFPLDLINLLERLTELRETFTLTSLLKDMIKATDEEIHRVRSGKISSAGTSVPMELGYISLLIHGCGHPPRSSPNSILFGLYKGFLT